MVLEAFFSGLSMYSDPLIWMFMGVGIVVGIIIGIIPGVGIILTLSLLLPFMFDMEPQYALAMLIASVWCNPIGGVVSTILLGVPGNIQNVASLPDGFSMFKKGRGARALGAALTSSGMAGIFGVVMSIAVVPLVLPLVYAVDSGDMVFLIFMGLAFIAVLSQGSPLKGLSGGFIGIILSFIGAHIITGEFRFTFGSEYLIGGLPIVAVALGLFALPEVFAMATEKNASGGAIERVALGLGDVLLGVRDCFRFWLLWLRCLVIGWFIGILPGVGGVTAIWIAYGHAKQSSKYPDRFGEGVVEGVIAPECAANAESTGALLTTLALGIPGNAALVLVLASLDIMNIAPGPEMMTTRLPLSFSTMQAGMFSAFIGAIICLLTAPYLIRLAKVPTRIMLPIITIAIFIGAFADDGIFWDTVVCLVFGILGWFMKKYGFNRACVVLGFVMGDLFEKYLFIATRSRGSLFFLKPTTLGIIAVTIVLFSYEPLMRFIKRRRLGKGVEAL